MFKRLGNLIRRFLELFVGGLEQRTPESLLEIEKENLRGQIAKYHQALASHASLCERLMIHVKDLERAEEDLRTKTTAHIRAGKREAAGACAFRLQNVQRELEENRSQLEEAEASYRELLKARDTVVKLAQAKIEALRASLNDLKVRKAIADLGETTSQITASGDTLDRLTRMVNEERYKAIGHARFAREFLGNSDPAFKEFGQEALAEQALIDFAAREGLTLEDNNGASKRENDTRQDGPAPQ